MKKLQARFLAAGAALVLFLVAAWVASATMTLTPTERWVLRIVLAVLGLAAAGLIVWFMRPKPTDDTAVDTSGDDAIATIQSARKRLPRGTFDQRPLVLLLGATGSCKTTVVTRSGLDPELLAGEATGTDAATEAVNVWAVRDAILAEAGGPLLTDATRWQRVVRALRPPRVAAAVGRGEVAPRAAVLCVSCDLFYTGGAGEQLEQLAQLVRQRLAEASREFGLKLPVYVLFTKADKIPHYEAWAATFTRDEVRAPLGAALPFDAVDAAGAHAERLAPRLSAAFDEITQSLALRRLELLGREAVGEKRLSSYELPREFRKVAVAAAKFLVEVTRPMQLGVSPQLRGFYFVGARPVVVRDVAVQAAAPMAQAPKASDATAVFSRFEQPAAPVAAAASGPARKVPEWMFLDRFFTDVVLADRGASSAASGGVRVHRLRRALLGTAIGVAAVASLLFTVSWAKNRALTGRVQDAARAVAALPQITAQAGTIVFPPPEALRRLDDLRLLLDTVRGYTAEGAPLSMRMGLWSGPALLEAATPVWLQGFRQQLYTDTWKALVDSLRALPAAPQPDDDFGLAYNRLKAYLITTDEHARSTPDFLAPVLLASWLRGQDRDADEVGLSRLQFEFFAKELAREHPWPTGADARLVGAARGYLSRSTGAEPIYQSMLAEAGKANPSIRLAQAVPNSVGVLASSGEVAGAFSTGGWSFMQDAFRNPERYFQGEEWVVGDSTAALALDQNRIIAELRERYRNDYINQWRLFVRSTAVIPPGSTRDAAQKLGILGGAQSPLLGLFALVARNTDADSLLVAAFQPVHAVTPPAVKDKLVSEPNQPYANGLLNLQGALELVANMPPVVDTASAQAVAEQARSAQMEATKAKVAARQVAQNFAVDPEASQVGPVVSMLLEAPISGAENVLRTAASTRPPQPRIARAQPALPPAGGGGGGGASPAAELNAAGAAFCQELRGITTKYPFNPSVTSEASVSDLLILFQPETGLLSQLQARLEPHLVQRGTRWAASPNATLAINEPFLTFFNNASGIANALFPNGATEPRVRVDAKTSPAGEVRRVILTHGGKVAQFDERTPANVLEWPVPAGSAQAAKLEAEVSARFGRTSRATLADESGEWALFRLIGKGAGAWGNGELKVTYTEGDRTVVVGYTFAGGLPLMQRGWLGQALNCPTPVVKP
jgi:type VI secretion system protein ImpL